MTDETAGGTDRPRLAVGVVGATGIVGQELLSIMAERDFPVGELRVYASSRSVGRKISYRDTTVVCAELQDGCFDGLDIVVMDVDDPIAAQWAPHAAAAGAQVIDNSSAFRMDADVPLVLAGVNDADLRQMPRKIASCPNCTTAVLLMALAPLHAAARIDRMVISSYQSVSGAGKVGFEELDGQTAMLGRDRGVAYPTTRLDGVPSVWPTRIAGNVLPLAGRLQEEGYTSEEWKMVFETRKILHDNDIKASVTCVRVPVYVGHSLSANLSFHRDVDQAEAVMLLRGAPGVLLIDDGNGYPTPQEAAGQDPVLVGRVRNDISSPGGINLWVTGDNLRRGAALNAVQLAEGVIANLVPAS